MAVREYFINVFELEGSAQQRSDCWQTRKLADLNKLIVELETGKRCCYRIAVRLKPTSVPFPNQP